MENLKLISVRLEPETLKKIDDIAAKTTYRKRSFIIQQILRNVIECADSGALHKIIDTFFAYEKGYKVEFRIDRDALKNRSAANV